MPAMSPAAFSGIPKLDRPHGTTHGVYVLTDSRGTIVYVGVGANPRNRIVWHRSHAAWWPDDGTVEISVEWFEDAASAGVREMDLIERHQPRGNRAGVKYRCAPFGVGR